MSILVLFISHFFIINLFFLLVPVIRFVWFVFVLPRLLGPGSAPGRCAQCPGRQSKEVFASLLLVAMPGFLVVWPGAPSSVLAPS